MDKDPKSEARNSKQAPMFKTQISKTREFRILKFEFWICFGIRYSNFGFFNNEITPLIFFSPSDKH